MLLADILLKILCCILYVSNIAINGEISRVFIVNAEFMVSVNVYSWYWDNAIGT